MNHVFTRVAHYLCTKRYMKYIRDAIHKIIYLGGLLMIQEIEWVKYSIMFSKDAESCEKVRQTTPNIVISHYCE